MMRERKPAWLRLMAPEGNLFGYRARRCNCGRWVFQTRDACQWEDWNPPLLHGDAVVMAVLCRRVLMRVAVTCGPPVLTTVWAGRGLSVDGWYVEAHECGVPPLGGEPYRPRRRAARGDGLGFLPDSVPCGLDPWASRLVVAGPSDGGIGVDDVRKE